MFDKKNPKLPTIDEISTEVPAISEYFEANLLPEAFRQAGIDTLPIVDINGYLIGIVSEHDLAKVLPEWSFEEESYRHNIKVSDLMTRDVWAEKEFTNVESLLNNIHKMHIRVIPIINDKGQYTGRAITRTAIISFLTRMVKPRSIGGLATPLGVYMTDGKHQSGPGNWGLLSTGFALACIALTAQLITGFVISFINLPQILILIFQLSLFILILRITPLVKYHAAEHQTIHAMEKGLPLTIETVRSQPRAHKRCGTNIMVLLIGIQLLLLFTVETLNLNPYFQFWFLMIGLLFIFANWRKFGMLLQKYLTTANASNSQIQNAIDSGESLLKKYKEDSDPTRATFGQKIWNMGILQVLFAFLSTLWILNTILFAIFS